MRLFEILEARVLYRWATDRFVKDFAHFSTIEPKLPEELQKFLIFRDENLPTEKYGKKDTMFANAKLKVRIKHAHLFFGKIIVFYRQTESDIYLYLLCNHAAYNDDAKVISLINWFNRQDDSDFSSFALNVVSQHVSLISAQEKATLEQFLWEAAGEFRDLLEKAASGDLTELMEYLVTEVHADISDVQKETEILTAFGGKAAFIALINSVLEHTHIKRH
jgi:hypothetical protein